MAGGRYVVLAVGRGDRAWLHGLPGVEVVHCTDVDEALVRLGGSRPSSALVVDGPIDGAGPDLIPAARRVAVPVLTTRAGVPGTLVVSRTGGGLLAALGRWARPVPGND